MPAAQSFSKIEPLNRRFENLWAGISEFELHSILKEITRLYRGADLEETAVLHTVRGLSLLRLGAYAEAEESFRVAGDVWKRTGSLSGQFTSLVNGAVARELDGRFAEALEALLNASDLVGDDAWTSVFLLTNLVGVLAKLRRYDEAITLFEKVKEAMDRENADHLYRVAEAAAEIGRFHEAVGFLAAMIRIVSGTDGTDHELVMRFRADLRLGEATLRAVAFVEGYEGQSARESVAVDPDFEAAKVAVMEEWAPLRERANGVILEH